MSLYNYAYFPLLLSVHTQKSHETACLGRDPAGREEVLWLSPGLCCLTASTPKVLPLPVPEWEQETTEKKKLQPSETS